MKKKFVLLLLTALLTACGGGNDTSSSASEETSILESSESTITINVDEELIGTWYIYTSFTGCFLKNTPFEVTDHNTLIISKVEFPLVGHYADFEETFMFGNGYQFFIISYDPYEKGVDWAYYDADEYSDMGFATAEIIEKYEYSGTEWPMDLLNTFLETDGNIPQFVASSYLMDLGESAIYDCKYADIEVQGKTLTDLANYIQLLVANDFVFGSFTGSCSEQTFYVGYDKDKKYSLRLIHFPKEEDVDEYICIFVYKYSEKISG